MHLRKYHGLGNDYLVFDANDNQAYCWSQLTELSPQICDRHFGVGGDGILWLEQDSNGQFVLRIINPDGSEAEKSGNGLRIAARYLWDQARVHDSSFAIQLPHETVQCQIEEQGERITVELGQATFASQHVPVTGPDREVLSELLLVGDREFQIAAVSVGNPHCVVFQEAVSKQLAEEYGPLIETNPWFPNRINVQFVRVVNEHRLSMEIWERGAGYTLASGSSSSAAAAAAVRLGYCQSPVTVAMPGGLLEITVGPDFQLTMTGPACKIADIHVASTLLSV